MNRKSEHPRKYFPDDPDVRSEHLSPDVVNKIRGSLPNPIEQSEHPPVYDQCSLSSFNAIEQMIRRVPFTELMYGKWVSEHDRD